MGGDYRLLVRGLASVLRWSPLPWVATRAAGRRRWCAARRAACGGAPGARRHMPRVACCSRCVLVFLSCAMMVVCILQYHPECA